eukprot:gene10795-49951_t
MLPFDNRKSVILLAGTRADVGAVGSLSGEQLSELAAAPRLACNWCGALCPAAAGLRVPCLAARRSLCWTRCAERTTQPLLDAPLLDAVRRAHDA